MRTRYKFTENESVVMLCLWEKRAPLTVNEILSLCKDYSFYWRSIHGIMNSLLEKEAVVIVGNRPEGKHHSRTYLPLVSRDEYLTNQLETDPAYKPEVLPYVVSCLISSVKTTTLEKLREIVEAERIARA